MNCCQATTLDFVLLQKLMLLFRQEKKKFFKEGPSLPTHKYLDNVP